MPQTREQIREYMRRYVMAHRAEHNARGAAWRRTEAGRAYQRDYQRKYRAGLPLPVRREREKRTNLLAHYDITLEEYNVMLAKHAGGCWICGKKAPFGRVKYLCVDHDHATGKIRGLLCTCCNTFLGRVKDDVTKAVEYLRG